MLEDKQNKQNNTHLKCYRCKSRLQVSIPRAHGILANAYIETPLTTMEMQVLFVVNYVKLH